MPKWRIGFALCLTMLLGACVSNPDSAGDSAKAPVPERPKRVALLAPINTQGIPEPARSRAESVLDEIHRVLRKKGRTVERIDFESYRAIQLGTSSRDTPYDELFVSALISKIHNVRSHPDWDGVSWQIPTTGFPDNEFIEREILQVTVLSLKVEVRSQDAILLYQGIGGLDHLNHLRNAEGNRFTIETWPKTLLRKNRIQKSVELALRPYL